MISVQHFSFFPCSTYKWLVFAVFLPCHYQQLSWWSMLTQPEWPNRNYTFCNKTLQPECRYENPTSSFSLIHCLMISSLHFWHRYKGISVGKDGCWWWWCKKRKKNWVNKEGKIRWGAMCRRRGKVVMRGERDREREVTLSISSAPALWFLWGTDVRNLIQCLIPLYSLSPVPAPPTVCKHTQTPHTQVHTHIVSWERQSYI